MNNPIETYIEAGRKAAKATKQRDQGLAQMQHDWVRRALSLESPTDRQTFRAAFDAAYREESVIPH